MFHMIKAEQLKLKHTFGSKIAVIAPVMAVLLSLLLTLGQDFASGAWNWWYTILLPGMLGVLCYLSIKKDKKIGYYSIVLLPLSVVKTWFAKNAYCAFALLISNFIVFLGTYIVGVIFESNISIQAGFLAALLLTVSYLWEIPLFLFLSAKFGMFVSIFSSIVLAMMGTVTVSDMNLWWVFPPAIPVRLMSPVLGILPNGLPMPADSPLSNMNVILPGILLSLIWLMGMFYVTALWFQKRGTKK